MTRSILVPPSEPSAGDVPSLSLRPEAHDPLESRIASWVEGCDIERLHADYEAQNELAFAPDLMPRDLLGELHADARELEARVQRKYLPRFKKSGSVSFHDLLAEAPAVIGLYRSPAFIDLIARIVGRPLVTCPEADAHACALYYYTEPGDHIGWHYDTSHYRGERFTVLIALADDSSARLLGKLWKGVPDREVVDLALATLPGTCVVFNGDKLYHAVSPIGPGERRVMLSLEYVTDRSMGRWGRFVSSLKDAVAYFGFRQWLFRRRRARRR
jgi:hypothetical protein